MKAITFSSALAVFLSCALKPGLAGIPTAVFIFKFSFFETLLIAGGGGVSGVFFFTFLLSEIIKIYQRIKSNYFSSIKKRKKRIFSFQNRFIIKAKKKFGIIGISIISPVLLSIPLGVFLCLRFFNDKISTIRWMCISVIFWTIILFFLYNGFGSFFENCFKG